MTEELQVRRTAAAVWVTFNRPARRNAFTTAMYTRLQELCSELASDRSVRVLVLRGAGGQAFAAGNEITDFLDREPVAYERWIRQLLRSLQELPQVTVAAVEGACVGGGLAVATHCDLRIAAPSARFGYPIARTLGNALTSPVLYRCVAVFGESLTREMLLAARLIDADRAYAAGAVLSVSDSLDADLEALVENLISVSGVTQRATKQQLLQVARRTETPDEGDEELVRAVYADPDFAEGVRAFLAKERPRFHGGHS